MAAITLCTMFCMLSCSFGILIVLMTDLLLYSIVMSIIHFLSVHLVEKDDVYIVCVNCFVVLL